MNSLALIVGVGVVCVIILFLAQSFTDRKHQALKFLLIMFALTLIILIPKTTIDDQHICEVVTNSSTYDVSGEITTYTWTHYCFDRDDETPNVFYKTVLWTYYLFWAYIIVYLGYLSLMTLKDSVKGKKE